MVKSNVKLQMIKIIMENAANGVYKKNPFKCREHRVKHIGLLCGPPAVSLGLVCTGNTAKGKKQKPQLCAFLTLGASHSQEYCHSGFKCFVFVFVFLNGAWPSCRSNPCWPSLLAAPCSAGRAGLPGRGACPAGQTPLSPSSLSPISQGTLILSHFHSKLVPVYTVSVGTLLLKKYFANNILAVSNSPQPLPSYLCITVIILNPII